MLQNPNTQNQQPPWPVKNQYNLGENYGPGERLKVRCIAVEGLYYDFMRRREGDVFELIPQFVTVCDPKTGKPIKKNGEFEKKLVTAVDQFSDTTMELVESDTPESVSTAQGAINKASDQLIKEKLPAKR